VLGISDETAQYLQLENGEASAFYHRGRPEKSGQRGKTHSVKEPAALTIRRWSDEPIEQGLSLLQIERIEAFGKRTLDRGQEIVGLR
jgi:hypothetical protein